MTDDRFRRQRTQVLFLARRGFTAADLADLFRVSESDIRQRFADELAKARKQPLRKGEWPTHDKLRALQAENRKLRAAEEARTAAALAGIPICLSDADIKAAQDKARSRFAAALEQIADRQVRIATESDNAGDATRSAALVFAQAWPAVQKLEHTGPNGAPLFDRIERVIVKPGEPAA